MPVHPHLHSQSLSMPLHHLARFPVSIHEILASQKQITAHLENAAQLERPRYLTGRRKEPEHLHDITSNPACENGHTETFAGARLVVGQDLREREGGLDGKADGAEACGVEGVEVWDGGDQKFERDEGDEEVEEELYGLGISNSLSLAPENGIAASPPFEDGDGRWSRATFNSTN
jgi:hypothetical protein